ncbi:MAG: YceI family protein [Verrucomicrobiia bacterium]
MMKKTMVLAAAMAVVVAINAQEYVRFSPLPEGCKVRMDGTSTIHDWYAESAIIGGSVELDKNFPTDPSAKLETGKIKAKVNVRIPVRSLKSSSGRAMDNIMYEHMEVKQYPTIEYHLLDMELPSIPARGNPILKTTGELVVHGVTNKISMDVGIERIAKDKIKFYTPVPITLKMTDFKINPPNPNIGGVGIKTGDEVKVKFEWVLSISNEEQK